jgi:hypothetical protein
LNLPAFTTSSDIRIDWTGVKALETFREIICRASNRIFVGRPLCESIFHSQYSCLCLMWPNRQKPRLRCPQYSIHNRCYSGCGFDSHSTSFP